MVDLLATPADLALQPGVPTLTDDEATRLLSAATAVVQAVTGQRLVMVVDDEVELEVLDGCSPNLELPERPIESVTSATIGATPVTDYKVVRSRLWRPNGWRSTTRIFYDEPTLVTVVYSHGYDTTDHRIELAKSSVLMLAAGAVNGSGVTSESIDDYQVVYDKMAARMDGADFLVTLLRKTYGRPLGSIRVRP